MVETQLIDVKNIHSLSEFKRRTTDFVGELKKNGPPLVLTVNGKAEIVVLGAELFQRLIQLADEVETIHAIREGLDAFERGEGRPARKALEEIRKKYAPQKVSR